MNSNPNMLFNARVPQRQSQRQRGFTLVEILIGMALGLFLTAGILQLFVANKQTYKLQDGSARIQEDGRMALEVLANSIRMATFTGGSPGVALVNALKDHDTVWWENFATNAVRGYDGTQDFTGAAFGTDLGPPVERIANTDAIIILGGGGGFYDVTTINPSPVSFTVTTLERPNGVQLGAGDIVFVFDADTTALFQITSISGNDVGYATTTGSNPGNSTITTDRVNGANFTANQTSMVDFMPTGFFIGPSESGTNRSLYQMQLDSGNAMVAEEVVEGVWDMQLHYGVDTTNPADKIPDAYRDATDVTDWSRVISVRVSVLLASEDNMLEQPQTYLFPQDIGDSAVALRSRSPSDRRMYKTFFTTVGIRNRVP